MLFKVGEGCRGVYSKRQQGCTRTLPARSIRGKPTTAARGDSTSSATLASADMAAPAIPGRSSSSSSSMSRGSGDGSSNQSTTTRYHQRPPTQVTARGSVLYAAPNSTCTITGTHPVAVTALPAVPPIARLQGR